MAGSGFVVVRSWTDRPEPLVGSGGRGRTDLVLSEGTRPKDLGGDDVDGLSSAEGICSTAAFTDLTLFDRGRSEALPGEMGGILPAFARASDALVGVCNDVDRPPFGRGRVDSRNAVPPPSIIAARPAETSPNVDFLLFAGASFSFSSLFDSAEWPVNGLRGMLVICV